MKSEINDIREKLYKEMKHQNNNHKEIIRVSEELDKLIVKYHLEEEERLNKNNLQ